MKRSRTLVFVGPTMPQDEARLILPDATYLPPARQADLLSAVVNLRPDAVGLIDGVFLHMQSVWHKEILYALEHGVRVFGASSIGALRAAETDAFGMVGVGEIYRRYASGELLDDDEVALLHGGEVDGYRKLSEPMVNIRATFAAAEDVGLLEPSDGTALVAIAKELYFAERTFPRIFEEARVRGVNCLAIETMARYVVTDYVDLKAQDAALLLHAIQDLGDSPEPFRASHKTAVNIGLATMYNRDRVVPVGSDLVSLGSIAEQVALSDPEFHDLNFNAMNRALGCVLARILRVEPAGAEVEAEGRRFRQRHDLEETGDFEAWLSDNHLSTPEFEALMNETAMCRALHRWLIYMRFAERTTKILLDHLRGEDRYRPWAERAAAAHRLVDDTDPFQTGGAIDLDIRSLIDEHEHCAGVRFDADPAQWAEEAGFNSEFDLKVSLVRANLAREALLTLLTDALPDGDEVSSFLGVPD
jgi:hypothetical protein